MKCSNCGTLIQSNAKFCSHCGKQIHQLDGPDADTASSALNTLSPITHTK